MQSYLLAACEYKFHHLPFITVPIETHIYSH